jgi:acetylornithine/N-succinyldiaminopimelate aminotransferase
MEVRGKGLMLGFKLADGHVNAELVKQLLERGLLTVPAGDNVIRLLPPLIVGADEVGAAIGMLEALFQSLDEADGARRRTAS